MIIFTDIDDTLMKTARKSGDISNMIVGALNHNGENNSFIDEQRHILIQELLLKQTCIPVTARSKASFDNLLLKFSDHAVLNFGATILDKNKNLDESWFNHIQFESLELNQKSIFQNIEEQLQSLLVDFEVKIVVEDGLSCYMNYRNLPKDGVKIDELRQTIHTWLAKNQLEDKFYFYQTDRDLALIPMFIKKDLGVAYIMQTYYSPKDLTIGLGDHKNDLSFMKICDFIMVPTDSSLMKLIQDKV